MKNPREKPPNKTQRSRNAEVDAAETNAAQMFWKLL
jgi:hypothetical protein